MKSKGTEKQANPSDGSFELLPSRLLTFRGPLTKCLEEDDEILYDADRFVPNGTTIRIKVYLPNKKPLFVVVKKDATVQDTIEMTIRKSNALAAAFQREYAKRKTAAEKTLQQEKEQEVSADAHSPPLECAPLYPSLDPSVDRPLDRPLSPRHNSLYGLKDLLNGEPFASEFEAGGTKGKVSVRVDDIKGVDAMPLLTDSMAYELRMAVGDGECDMDFPGGCGVVV